MEIRTIAENEAVTFLQIVCDAFDLDFARARTVYFNEPFFDLSRKWTLIDDGHLASVLTCVPLQFGWGEAVGIASVATRPNFRSRGYATELLRSVIGQYEDRGVRAVYLFAQNPAMYYRMGFEPIDDMIRVPLPPQEADGSDMMPFEEVRRIYDAWAGGHPDRLRRDDTRWKAWRWGMRGCAPVSGGYVCIEGSQVREAIMDGDVTWPVGQMTDWTGLGSVSRALGLSQGEKTAELLAFGDAPRPQLFLTDQF